MATTKKVKPIDKETPQTSWIKPDQLSGQSDLFDKPKTDPDQWTISYGSTKIGQFKPKF